MKIDKLSYKCCHYDVLSPTSNLGDSLMTAIEVSPSVQAMIGLIEQAELSDEQASAMNAFLADLLEAAKTDKLTGLDRAEFRSNLNLERIQPEQTFTQLTGVVLPDKARTLGDRIADGGYDWLYNDITEKRFPLTLPGGLRELATIWFQRNVKSEHVEDWTAKNGYEVALIDDLLAVGSHSEYRKL